jgi:hypothetical protein
MFVSGRKEAGMEIPCIVDPRKTVSERIEYWKQYFHAQLPRQSAKWVLLGLESGGSELVPVLGRPKCVSSDGSALVLTTGKSPKPNKKEFALLATVQWFSHHDILRMRSQGMWIARNAELILLRSSVPGEESYFEAL